MGKVMTGAYNPLPVVPIVLVGANVKGKANYMTVGFVNGVNIKPAIVCVSLNKKHHTQQGIIENGTFSINVPSADYVIETDYCGLVSGKNADKSSIFSSFYGELKTAPMIEEFPIVCECLYTGQSVEFDMDTAYFGEIVQVYVNEELLNEKQKIDIQQANPIYYSGLENQYRALHGETLGPGWRIGRQYRRKKQEREGPKYRCKLIERSAQPALTIRTRMSPIALGPAIGESLAAVAQYAGENGYVPSGPPFVAYHGFDGQMQDVEIGFPFASDIEGNDTIALSELPGGKAAGYMHVGPYEKLPEIRTELEQWLKEKGHTVSGTSYEIYLNDPRTTAPEQLETEIMYPVLSKG